MTCSLRNSPNSAYSALRFGSLITSNEDCVLVTLISYVPRALNLRVKSDIVTLIFEPRATDEMTQMFSQGEEISKLDSYFSYGKAMSIIDRSFFSATCSPHLYTYLNGLLIGRKDKRGLNANKLEGIGHADILSLSFFVSHALWDRAEYCQEIVSVRKAREMGWTGNTMSRSDQLDRPSGLIPEEDDSASVMDLETAAERAKQGPSDNSADGIFSWIDANKGKLPLTVIMVMLGDTPMRPGRL
ncbi:nucleoprotein [Biomphalaria glabrata]|nr:nucleoprotein [Biomphalaria glabrata]